MKSYVIPETTKEDKIIALLDELAQIINSPEKEWSVDEIQRGLKKLGYTR